jgi:hypothetical protein
LHTLFEQFNLKITAQVNHQSVNFLLVTFNLAEERYQPYRKPDNEPIYIDSRSNRPPAIIRQLPKSINHRISNLSSDQQTFNSSASTYENALRPSNYDFNLQYNATPSSKTDAPNNESCTSQPKRKRHRNIIWFNPPYRKNVVTNIGKTFLQLIDKHFPKSSRLQKIFKRNSIKISYSCMKKVKTTISNHNTRSRSTEPTATKEINCNCRKKDECRLQRKCLTQAIVYQSEVKSYDNGETKRYIGLKAGEFKDRYRNHKKSFELQR